MKFLIIGLGSMGKRRIRCLKALGYKDIYGLDVREDRRKENEVLHGIKTYENISQALTEVQPDALIISVPPDLHHYYIKVAIEHHIHFFVEASVVDTDMEWIKKELTTIGIVAAPSATLCFHPAIKIVGDIIQKGELGKLSNIILHSGQYLPDWHTYESVSEYYVSNPATSGGREIVPFELTWFTEIFGFPQRVCGNFRKTIDIHGAETIDDTYNCLLDYGNFLAIVTVDVVSRHATRRLVINGDKKQLVWDWDSSCVKIYDPEKSEWVTVSYEMNMSAQGYNSNIGENMYIEEIKSFIDAIVGTKSFINTMEKDHRVLQLLYAIEEADKSSRYVGVN